MSQGEFLGCGQVLARAGCHFQLHFSFNLGQEQLNEHSGMLPRQLDLGVENLEQDRFLPALAVRALANRL